jgi:hypothetical protein
MPRRDGHKLLAANRAYVCAACNMSKGGQWLGAWLLNLATAHPAAPQLAVVPEFVAGMAAKLHPDVLAEFYGKWPVLKPAPGGAAR